MRAFESTVALTQLGLLQDHLKNQQKYVIKKKTNYSEVLKTGTIEEVLLFFFVKYGKDPDK